MTKPTPTPASSPVPILDAPLAVEAADREVRLGIPDDGVIVMTADAAEASGIRLLDAAVEARKRP